MDRLTNVRIIDIPGLHRLIGHQLVNRRGCLVSSEMRFLRQQMNLSRQSLGNKLGVEIAFIEQWEQHKTRLPRIADVSLRALYACDLLGGNETELSLHILSDAECALSAENMVLSWSPRGWQAD
ncbi:transcriptional regulator [Acerihabitans sp. TG2]|uniref:helix-turn-helix domain-containing protein n=1 Tax=Acerihabitans sp. TG2 TaxID=3096008 RepID=UPI002B23CB8B|nr:transcriptional regulator [Acerihabitans sp. TG2]MEA9391381.1 transcriptional regulator [Acerihabitans sp. TG2]